MRFGVAYFTAFPTKDFTQYTHREQSLIPVWWCEETTLAVSSIGVAIPSRCRQDEAAKLHANS
ncbi:MAG TPA: hypothetical protein V6D50_24500 [Chroococcales cyanobacterium]